MTYVIVGEAWGAEENAVGAPFVGPSGRELRSQLSALNIDDFYLTNVFNFQPKGNNLNTICTGRKTQGIDDYPPLIKTPQQWVKREYSDELTRLWSEIAEINPPCVIALGATALWALRKETGIGDFRGYDLQTEKFAGKRWPLLATWHPTAVLRQYSLRTVTLMDLGKAVDFSRIDLERETIVPETREDLTAIPSMFAENQITACDIETAGEGELARITEVGFSLSPEAAITIPFETLNGKSYWPTPTLEKAAWRCIQSILSKCNVIGHNFSYDMQYLWKVAGVTCERFCGDTMLLHHALQPEMRKSLGFLASLYTSAPRWKHVRKENKEIDT